MTQEVLKRTIYGIWTSVGHARKVKFEVVDE